MRGFLPAVFGEPLARLRRVLARVVWRGVLAIWCPRISVRGLHRVPAGPVIFAPNHASHADTPLVQWALASRPEPLAVAGAADYWFRNRTIGAAALAIGVFPFPRSGPKGIDRTVWLLHCGTSVVLYPQGTRVGGPFRRGVGRIARRSRVPIVPVRIEGTGELLPRGRTWPRPSSLRVTFADPLTIQTSETSEEFAARLEGSIWAQQLRRAA